MLVEPLVEGPAFRVHAAPFAALCVPASPSANPKLEFSASQFLRERLGGKLLKSDNSIVYVTLAQGDSATWVRRLNGGTEPLCSPAKQGLELATEGDGRVRAHFSTVSFPSRSSVDLRSNFLMT